jgi:hypothetical protein
MGTITKWYCFGTVSGRKWYWSVGLMKWAGALSGRKGILCQIVLTLILKQLTDSLNKHLEGAGVFDALTGSSERGIPKMTGLLS